MQSTRQSNPDPPGDPELQRKLEVLLAQTLAAGRVDSEKIVMLRSFSVADDELLVAIANYFSAHGVSID
jgi:hypothetical protein